MASERSKWLRKGQDGFNDTKVYKAAADDEDAQLDDHKATSADSNSFDDPSESTSEPQEYLKARTSNMKEIDHNPGEESKDQKEWEMEEPVDTYEDLGGGLNDNYEEENPDEILENHDKFPVTKVANKQVTQLDRLYFSPENNVAYVDVRKILKEGKKHESVDSDT